MSTPSIHTIAIETINALAERDWCQGQPENADGRLCLVGAINVAAYGESEPHGNDALDYCTPAVEAVAQAFLDLGISSRYNSLGDAVSAMYAWNDNPHRTAIQVASALILVALHHRGE